MQARQILSKSWDIYAKNWQLIAIIAFLVYLPFNLFLEFSLVNQVNLDDIQSLLTATRVGGFYELLIGSFAMILITFLTKEAFEGKETSFGELWSKKLNIQTYGQYVWTTLIKNILLGLLFFLLIIPGIIFAVYWLFAEQIAILENEGGIKALSKAKKMVDGNWWKFFVIALIGFLIPAIGSAVLGIVQLVIWNHLLNLLILFVSDLLQAFLIVYLAVAYLENSLSTKS